MVREKLVGRTIVDCEENRSGFVLTLDNGEKVDVSVELDGGQGADGGWYQWGVLKVNDKTLVRV